MQRRRINPTTQTALQHDLFQNVLCTSTFNTYSLSRLPRREKAATTIQSLIRGAAGRAVAGDERSRRRKIDELLLKSLRRLAGPVIHEWRVVAHELRRVRDKKSDGQSDLLEEAGVVVGKALNRRRNLSAGSTGTLFNMPSRVRGIIRMVTGGPRDENLARVANYRFAV